MDDDIQIRESFAKVGIHRAIDCDPPPPEMITWIMKANGLTGREVAEILHVSSRTVRKWTSPEGTSNHTKMPYSAWWMLNKVTEERMMGKKEK